VAHSFGSEQKGMVLAHRKAGVETQRLSASAGKSYVGTQWLSAAEASTGIRVVNVGRKPADYSVTFFAPDSSVVYQVKGPKLKPGEEALVDLAQLREQGIADQQGRRMPLALEEGTFEVETSDTSNDALLFAAATSPSADPAAAPAPLGAYCCGRVAPYIQPYPMWVFLYEFSLASVYVQDTCTGQRRGTAASWWTDDTMIASVDSLGNVYGFGPGATNVDAEVELWLSGPFGCGDHWFETVYAPVNVRQPYQVQVGWTVNQGYAQCALSGQNGWIRNVENELEDQFGFAIQQSQILMADTISIGSPNDLGISGQLTGSDTTDASGQWFDTYYVCSYACPSSSGETDALQTWTYDGIGLPHTNAIKYKCSAITVDGR
jgi:hypothetical protein